MKQGFIALLCMLSFAVQAQQDVDWKNLTQQERDEVCMQDMSAMNTLLQYSVRATQNGDFDTAQELNDRAFYRGLAALACSEQFKETLRGYQEFILENDDAIACGWHMDDGRKKYIRAELKFSQFDDPEGSLFELNESIYAYETALTFCPEDMTGKIDELMKGVIDTRDKVESFGEFIRGD